MPKVYVSFIIIRENKILFSHYKNFSSGPRQHRTSDTFCKMSLGNHDEAHRPPIAGGVDVKSLPAIFYFQNYDRRCNVFTNMYMMNEYTAYLLVSIWSAEYLRVCRKTLWVKSMLVTSDGWLFLMNDLGTVYQLYSKSFTISNLQ